MSNITITLRWTKDDEGRIRISKEFVESAPILQLDMLKDRIFELMTEYNRILENGFNKKRNK